MERRKGIGWIGRRSGRLRVTVMGTCALLLGACGGTAAPQAVHPRVQAPPPTPSPAPTATPTFPPPPPPLPVAAAVPAETPIYQFAAPSVGVDLPVIAVTIVRGAMDAPEGPLSSRHWHEAFWLKDGAPPGGAGVTTVAGHLDDTAGRPAAFWNIRRLQVGDVVTMTRLSDGASVRYRIVDVEVYTDTVAQSPAVLQRLYGSVAGGANDGVPRISLITCTGHWRGAALGYDHRFMAFGEMLTG